MDKVKFGAERFRKDERIEIRFSLRGPVLAAGIKDIATAAGFELAEGLSNTYYAWAKTPDEVTAIQGAIKPLVLAGKVSV